MSLGVQASLFSAIATSFIHTENTGRASGLCGLPGWPRSPGGRTQILKRCWGLGNEARPDEPHRGLPYAHLLAPREGNGEATLAAQWNLASVMDGVTGLLLETAYKIDT